MSVPVLCLDDDEASLEWHKTDAELKAEEAALWAACAADNVRLARDAAPALAYFAHRDTPIRVRVQVRDDTRRAAPSQSVVLVLTGPHSNVQAVRRELTRVLKRGAAQLTGTEEEIEVHSARAGLRAGVPLSDGVKLNTLWTDEELVARGADLEARITERSPPPSPPTRLRTRHDSDSDVVFLGEHVD